MARRRRVVKEPRMVVEASGAVRDTKSRAQPYRPSTHPRAGAFGSGFTQLAGNQPVATVFTHEQQKILDRLYTQRVMADVTPAHEAIDQGVYTRDYQETSPKGSKQPIMSAEIRRSYYIYVNILLSTHRIILSL